MRNHFIILLKQIYTWCVTSLLLLSRLSLCLWPLTVDDNVPQCGSLCVYSTWSNGLYLSENLGSFWPLFLQIIFLPFLSLLSFLDSHNVYVALLDSIVKFIVSSFLFHACLFLLYIQVHWLFLLLTHICCWTLLMDFSFQLLYFELQNFLLVSFKIFSLLIL